MRPLTDAWRSTTARLILIYGALFAIWGVALLGLVQWKTTHYLNGVLDQMLLQRMHYLVNTDMQRLPATVDTASMIDPQGVGVMSLGLFDARGRRLAGNIDAVPVGLAVQDGNVKVLDVRLNNGAQFVRTRAVSQHLKDGRTLVLAKDNSTVEGIGAITCQALWWGLSLTLLPGLLGGIALARGPMRRIRAIQRATDPIRAGDLSQRLPVSRRGDELDKLAGIVNAMLGEIERLMGEVKGVCDNIAHDLRTPLTRLRARLYRAQQQLDGLPQSELIEACVVDTDALLTRFRALLRVSELEDHKRSACSKPIQLEQVLRQVHDFYAPLAEDRDQPFALELEPLKPIQADEHLLFEAFANLVSNAIKFTPPGGRVCLRARMERGWPRVDVLDSGPGIPPDERVAVMRRFYRGDNSRSTPGSGLGLSIVSAIARLHGFTLEIDDAAQGAARGARISLYCQALKVGALPQHYSPPAAAAAEREAEEVSTTAR